MHGLRFMVAYTLHVYQKNTASSLFNSKGANTWVWCSMPSKCRLKPVSTGGQFDAPQEIHLPDDETIVLGRSPLTGIVDKKLSRQHVELTANCSSKTVQIRQIGPNPAYCLGKELDKDETVELSDGDKLQLLTGTYEFRICFSSKSGSQDTSTDKADKKSDVPKATPDSTHDSGASTIESQVSSSSVKKRTLDMDGDDNGNGKPVTKKSRTGDDGKGSAANDTADDIDDKLAALQHKAETAEQKRAEAKKPKSEAAGGDSGSPKAADGGNGPSSSTEMAPAADAGKPSTDAVWREEDKLIVFKSVGVKARAKIVCFDMDGTLITTASGKVFPQNADDWRILYSEVPGLLKKLHAAGFKIVIFTNQLGVSKGKLTVKDLRRKITNVQRKMGVPIQAFAATSGGMYRKPSVGMWNYLLSKENDGIKVDMKWSIFVGDAAGRPVDWAPKKKKDFSCSDRLFALNVGLPFKTPEEFFLGQKPAKFNMPSYDPKSVSTSTPLFSPPSTSVTSSVPEVLVLVGYPASGKSSFVKNHLLKHKYVHVNRDTIGTWQKCVAACSAALSKGQSVVIDNTNADLDSRKRYVDCAKKAGVQCRCFMFNATIDHARHNEKFRQLTPAGKNHASISDMVFFSFRKNFVPPKKEEGYAEVAQVNFVPSFGNAGEEKLYRSYLLEK